LKLEQGVLSIASELPIDTRVFTPPSKKKMEGRKKKEKSGFYLNLLMIVKVLDSHRGPSLFPYKKVNAQHAS